MPRKNGIPNLDLQMVLKKINTPSQKMAIDDEVLLEEKCLKGKVISNYSDVF